MAVRRILKEVVTHLQSQGAVRVDQAPYWIAQLEKAEEEHVNELAELEARLAHVETVLGVRESEPVEEEPHEEDDPQ